MSYANKELMKLKKSACKVSSLPSVNSDSNLYNLSKINHHFKRQQPSTSSISSNSSINFRLNQRLLTNELDQIIKRLEQGSVLIKFFPKGKPERRTLVLNNETKQLICLKPNVGKEIIESIINLFEVKEVRVGRCSKVFEKWSEDARKWENNQCFVVLYGNTFCLKSLSCVATSPKECDQWVRCIQYISQETIQLSYFRLLNKWLKFEFNNLSNEKSLTSFKNIKTFLSKQINNKNSISRLKELFYSIDEKNTGEIGYSEFFNLCFEIFHDYKLFDDHFKFLTKDKNIIGINELTHFINQCQHETISCENAEKIIMKNLTTKKVINSEIFFTTNEFIDYLYSKENDIFDKKNNSVIQDMTRSLTHYYIASSHNTYLTGDQFKSESSVEAYARCLRMGCKCIELDCWDGPDGTPLIYHGHTLTTKIKFKDTVKTIRDNAFVKSDFPVILSIENHCSLPQQRLMADVFKEIFGDLLVTQPIERNENQMPSPSQLRRKIIIKHKKLSDHDTNDQTNEVVLKSGIMNMEDSETKEIKPYFFILTQTRLSYTDYKPTDDMEEDNEDKLSLTSKEDSEKEDELHLSEPWFHGKLNGKILQAEQLLKQYSNLGDGLFLVRESVTIVGEYSLSFLYDNKPNHCRIKSCIVNGKTKYYFVEKNTFDSLYALITYYQSNPLKSKDFTVKLQHPVPQPNSHESKSYYHKNLQRNEAEELLRNYQADGSFLVRNSEKDDHFSITFRTSRCIKHCRIKQQGRLFLIGNSSFTSLVELINFYQKYPLYGQTILKYPISVHRNQQPSLQPTDECEYRESCYLDTNFINKNVTCKAIYEYKAKKDDELSFGKNAIITNVTKDCKSCWWKGDYNGKKQGLFPQSYVIEIDDSDQQSDNSDEMPLGNLEKGFINVAGCGIKLPTNTQNSNRKFTFLICSQQKSLELTASTEDEFHDWLFKIKEAAEAVDNKLRQSLKIEQKEKIAKELSDLIVYCRSVPFTYDKFGHYSEMSSFNEAKGEKLINTQGPFLHKYNLKQFTRVYPNGMRVDSSNFDPIKFWNNSIQMVALNYQTADKSMQLNQARFLQNGSCGYVLKPEILLDPNFDLSKNENSRRVDPQIISLRIISGRHLAKSVKNAISPFVEVELLGADDDYYKSKTSTINDNGLNPTWDETFVFNVDCPELAFLRFVVYDVDMFGDSSFIAQATYPLCTLRCGYRSVKLKNEYSEEFELASLLVHLKIKNSKGDEEIYTSIRKLKEEICNLEISCANESKGDLSKLNNYKAKLEILNKQLNNKTGLINS